MRSMPELDGKPPQQFWEERYGNDSGATTGKPAHTLESHVGERDPGAALDLGCARGDDVVWLAKRGWRVLGVDIAEAALGHAHANAERNGMEDQVRLERHDLSTSFPTGTFDMITASFLHTPYDFEWGQVIHRAAASVRPGGLLLTVTHQRLAPWSWSPSDEELPDAETRLASIDLQGAEWRTIFVGPVDRVATRPDGQSAPVRDAVIALERLSGGAA